MAKYEFSDGGSACVVTKRVWWAPWRRVQATIRRVSDGYWKWSDGRWVGFAVESDLEAAREGGRWTPIAALPKARLLSGKTTL